MLAWRTSTIIGPGSTSSSPSTLTFRPSAKRAAAKSDPAHACWTCHVLACSHSLPARAEREQPDEQEDEDRDRLAHEVDPEDEQPADRHERDAPRGEPEDVDDQRDRDQDRQQQRDEQRPEDHRRDRPHATADHLAPGLVNTSSFHARILPGSQPAGDGTAPDVRAGAASVPSRTCPIPRRDHSTRRRAARLRRLNIIVGAIHAAPGGPPAGARDRRVAAGHGVVPDRPARAGRLRRRSARQRADRLARRRVPAPRRASTT